MSLDDHSTAPNADIHENHYCDFEYQDGVRCQRWGSFGFEESKAITLWYCREHRPVVYRGLTFRE